jgi:predicted nucleic acid-binding protein
VEAVILDAGPLVAYFDPGETHHEWCVRQFDSLKPPLLTCEAALAEAVYLIRNNGGRAERIFDFLRDGIIEVPFRLAEEAGAIAMLMGRYADLPMDLADACLVRMAEKHHDVRVFTLDGDFKIYRRHGRQVIPLIFPNT